MKKALFSLVLGLFSTATFSQISINASQTQGCYPMTVNFMYNGPASDQWAWDFGDGSPLDFTQNPTHVYTSPGSFGVFMERK